MTKMPHAIANMEKIQYKIVIRCHFLCFVIGVFIGSIRIVLVAGASCVVSPVPVIVYIFQLVAIIGKAQVVNTPVATIIAFAI